MFLPVIAKTGGMIVLFAWQRYCEGKMTGEYIGCIVKDLLLRSIDSKCLLLLIYIFCYFLSDVMNHQNVIFNPELAAQ